jgi:hypothetical protein
MAYMNPFNVSNEIKNLNNIITNLKNENHNLKENYTSLNSSVNNVQLNKLDKIDIVNAVDEIKEELLVMNNKIDRIIRKQFMSEIDKMQENEVYDFLKSNNIESDVINILLFLEFKTIQDLIMINIEEIKHYGIKESILESIIHKAREEMGTLV